eukprot:31497-Pelagococcus_subviridis.AAC.53
MGRRRPPSAPPAATGSRTAICPTVDTFPSASSSAGCVRIHASVADSAGEGPGRVNDTTADVATRHRSARANVATPSRLRPRVRVRVREDVVRHDAHAVDARLPQRREPLARGGASRRRRDDARRRRRDANAADRRRRLDAQRRADVLVRGRVRPALAHQDAVVSEPAPGEVVRADEPAPVRDRRQRIGRGRPFEPGDARAGDERRVHADDVLPPVDDERAAVRPRVAVRGGRRHRRGVARGGLRERRRRRGLVSSAGRRGDSLRVSRALRLVDGRPQPRQRLLQWLVRGATHRLRADGVREVDRDRHRVRVAQVVREPRVDVTGERRRRRRHRGLGTPRGRRRGRSRRSDASAEEDVRAAPRKRRAMEGGQDAEGSERDPSERHARSRRPAARALRDRLGNLAAAFGAASSRD